jgi:hypothetical protein
MMMKNLKNVDFKKDDDDKGVRKTFILNRARNTPFRALLSPQLGGNLPLRKKISSEI